jgi:glycine/D-amino acid oxidase-like deaminating enzyme
MPGGGCHAYFTQEYFDEAKREVEELQRSSPEMGNYVRIVEDRNELIQLKIPTAIGAIVQAIAAKLSPYKLVCWILEYLIRTSGLNLQTTTPVVSLKCIPREGSPPRWEVCTLRGIVETSNVLITTNAYTSYLLPTFRSLIVPVRGEMAALRSPGPLMNHPLTHTYAFVGTLGQHRQQDDYLVQRPVTGLSASDGGELMFGGGRMKAVRKGVNVDNDDSIDAPVAEYLRRHLTEVLDMQGSPDASVGEQNQEIGLPAKKEWTGIMGFSRDGHPWVGAVPGSPGVWLSAAFSGSGMFISFRFCRIKFTVSS